MRSTLLAAALGVLLAAGDSARAEDNPWAAAKRPSRGAARSIGGYSAGCLAGGAALPVSGKGFRVMRPERRRHFGHPALVQFIRDLARAARREKLGPLGLGDLSQARGGPAPSGHSSHQTGLDADIWYRVRGAGKRAKQVRMVDHARGRPAAAWGKRERRLLELAARDPRVDRIFVHPLLKQSMCRTVRGERGWLRRIRPWWGHDEHFHVRLACPDGSRDCVPQAPVPEGDGCAELDAWLSPEAAAERAKKRKSYQSRVGARPALPDRCEALVR